MSDPSAPQDPFAGLPPEPADSSPQSGSQPPAYGSEPPVSPPYGAQPPTPPPYGQPPVSPPYGAQPPVTPPPYGQPPVSPPYGAQPPVAPPYGQPAAYGVQPPAYGSPPPYVQPGGYAQPAYGFPKNSLAVWSLVLGIVSFVLSCGFFTGVPAIIVGSKAKKAVAEGQANNGGMATAGIILGWVATGLAVIGIVIIIIIAATGNWDSTMHSSGYSNL